MELKYIEWNLHVKGGKSYKIPDFVADHLMKVDIFVLVEFCSANGWNMFRNKIEHDFDLYCSPYTTQGYNQVCIGIRKKTGYKLYAIITKDVCDTNIPEFLQVDISLREERLSIIGTRIKTESDTKRKQYEWLNEHLKDLDRFICLGDFNCVSSALSKFFDKSIIYGPRIVNGYYSYVFPNEERQGLDWALIKGMKRVYNGHEDCKSSPNATYDWCFVTENNGYDKKTEDNYLDINGLPDHAILKGMVDL